MKLKTRLDYKRRRHCRLRKKVRGTAARPRMSVCITGKHIYVQFVDDERGTTIVFLSTVMSEEKRKINIALAKEIGLKAAEAALSKGIKEVVFDRGGFAYTGRIKAVADAAREKGIKI